MTRADSEIWKRTLNGGLHERIAQERVLARYVFKVPTILRHARHIHSRPELHIGALAEELGAHGRAPLKHQVNVPRRADRHGAGPAGAGARIGIVAETLWAVVHLDLKGGDRNQSGR